MPDVNPIVDELTTTVPLVSWLLPDMLPAEVLLTLVGVPGAGKSYFAYSMGLALAGGVPVLGVSPIRPIRVLYCDQENSRADRLQYQRWAWHGVGAPALTLMAQNFWVAPFVLGCADWEDVLAGLIEQHLPELIIIDTATSACNINDENHNGEAQRIVNTLRRVIAVSQATCLVLKHARVDKTDGEFMTRGAKAWEGSPDGVWYLKRAKGRPYANGWSNLVLTPKKTRAFGLRDTYHIIPHVVHDGARGVLGHQLEARRVHWFKDGSGTIGLSDAQYAPNE